MKKNILSEIAKRVPVKLPGLSKDDRELINELCSGRKVTQELAVAVLVSEIALCDLKFDEREYEYLFNYFKEKFELQDGEIRRLIQQGTELMAGLRTTEMFAKHLVETTEEEERKDLLEMVKGLISVDDLEHGFELYLFKRLTTLLGFEPATK